MHKQHGTASMWAGVGRWKIVGSIVLAALLLALPALPMQLVRAATGVVASLNDDSTSGTLRQVIAAAQPNDTITFMAGLSGKIVLNNTPITLPANLTIQGPGAASITISGNNLHRVFQIDSGRVVAISGVTISEGLSSAGTAGGGLLNNGTLTLTNCTISGNRGSTGGSGGIANTGTLTVSGSSVSGNIGGNGGNGGSGINGGSGVNGGSGGNGGISNTGALIVSNSSVSANVGGNGGNGGSGAEGLYGNDGGTGGSGGDGSTGGIFNYSGTLIVRGSTVSANISGNGGSAGNGGNGNMLSISTNGGGGGGGGNGGGGGIFNYSGTMALSDSIINSNVTGGGGNAGNGGDAGQGGAGGDGGNGGTGGFGGGVSQSGAAVTSSTIGGSAISANVNGGGGSRGIGGIGYMGMRGNAGIPGTSGVGGGIANSGGPLAVTGSTISGNTGGRGGGGIYNEGTLGVANVTISGNTASGVSGGGGILNGGPLIVRSSTVVSNHAPATGIGGGGIRQASSTIDFANTLLTLNTANVGGTDYHVSGGTSYDNGNNFITAAMGQILVASDISGTISMLGMLADNGGAVTLPDGSHPQTITLLPGSPATDAGSDTYCAVPLVGNRDQRGVTRPKGSACDIGAFEVLPAALLTSTSYIVGTAGGRVTLTGTNLETVTSVTLDGATVSGVVSSAGGTQLSVPIPAHGTGTTVAVVVTNAGTTAANGTLMYATPNATPAPQATQAATANTPVPQPMPTHPAVPTLPVSTPLPQPSRH